MKANYTITFTKIQESQAYLIYLLDGRSEYTQETVVLSDMDGDNVTFTIKGADLSPEDRTIYVVANADSGMSPNVTF